MSFKNLEERISEALKKPYVVLNAGSSDQVDTFTNEGNSCVFQAIFTSALGACLISEHKRQRDLKLADPAIIAKVTSATGLPLVAICKASSSGVTLAKIA